MAPGLATEDVQGARRSSLVIERVGDAEAFRELASDWNALLQDSVSNSFFLTWEWLHTWWKHLAGTRTLFLLTVKSENRLVAIAPLSLRTRRAAGVVSVRTLEFLGSDRLSSDYLDLIIRRGWEAPVVTALVDYLRDHSFLLEIASIDKPRAVATGLAAALEQQGWRGSEEKIAVCPFITLAGHTWESYLATLGSEHRYNFNRRVRGLSKEFDVRFEVARAEGERREALETLITLHNVRRQTKGGSDAFHTPALLAFHEEVSRLAAARGWLRLFTLRLDRRPVAALYGFQYGRVFDFFQAGFDPAYAKHSVGLVTMGLAIKEALGEGAEEYDLLRGDERYKFLWAQQQRELSTLTLWPERARPRLYRRAQAATVAAKRTVRTTLPTPVLDWITAYRQRGLRNPFGVKH